MKVVIILGSNLGDRKKTIEEATNILVEKTGKLVAVSAFYETEPWGFESLDLFLNQVVVADTRLSPEQILQHCLETETQLGRTRSGSARYASRPIDIDILFCDSLVIDIPGLTIPHPRLQERNFVLAPLNELMPDFIHPVLYQKISALFNASPDTLKVRKL